MDAAPRGQQRYVSNEGRLNGSHGPRTKKLEANSGHGKASWARQVI